MSEYDRNKHYPKKQGYSARQTPTFTRGFTSVKAKTEASYSKSGRDSSSKDASTSETPKKQPIILKKKTKEPTEEAAASPKKIQRGEASSNVAIASTSKESEAAAEPILKEMTRAVKFLDEGVMCTESLHNYIMQDNNDFVVVGVVGSHGVGKSTLLNLLSQTKVTEEMKRSLFKKTKRKLDDYFEDDDDEEQVLAESFDKLDVGDVESKWKEVFTTQTQEDIESNLHATRGIDAFITRNRVIFLDCQPFMSVSVLEELIQSESKRTNLVSEFIPLENSGEIQGLQLTAFLMCVCHVLMVVQDWFFDSNIVRFIHTAEMLKPTISNPEDESLEHFPNLLLVHNKAIMEDFTPAKFKLMQDTYKSLFHKTKMRLNSNMGIGSGRIINYLNKDNCGSPINLFLIPEIDLDTNFNFTGHPPIETLIWRLRANLLGSPKISLTHIQLSEKTWLAYCSKAWETVKKSSYFVEYMKLMP